MQKLITDILSTAMAPQSWGNVLDEFNQSFNLTSSCVISYNESNNHKENLFFSDFFRERLPPEIIDYLISSDDDDTPTYRALMNMPPQELYLEEGIVSTIIDYRDSLPPRPLISKLDQQLERFPPSTVRSLMESTGILNRIPCKLNTHGPWMDCFIIHASNTKETNYVMQNDSISMMLPIISGAINLGRYIQALRSKYKAALSILDTLGLGVFLIDLSGNVIDHNAEAQRILDLKDGLSLSKQRKLKANSYIETAELDSVIKNSFGCFQGDYNKSSMLVSLNRPSKEYDFLVSVKPLFDSLGELESNLKCAFVTVIDPNRDKALSTEGLTLLGQLSNAETKIVDLLVKGLRPNEVAEQRNVSINTVKTQLKAITSKLHCNSQSDIIRVAAATKIPIE